MEQNPTTDVQQTTTEQQQEQTEDTSYEEQLDTIGQEAAEGLEDQEESEEAEETEEQEQQETEPEERCYTAEEFNNIDPYEVDPEKLPGPAKLVHQKYMDVYNRQILPELQQLRAFHQKVMSDIQAAQARQDPRKAFNQEVRARAMRELGVNELDETNADHVIELSRQSSLLAQEQAERQRGNQQEQAYQQNIINLRQRLYGEIQNFAELDRFVRDDLNNLPYSKAKKALQDIMSGDPDRTFAAYRMFEERMKKAKSVQVKTPEAPPKVIAGSKGTKETKSWNYGSWSGASNDDQARMLVEAGLLD